MDRLVPRALGMALITSMLVVACNPESPLAPETVTETAAAPQPRAVQAVPDEYIVLFDPNVSDPPGLARQLGAAYGLQVKHDYQYVFKGFSAHIPPQALAGLRNNPRVVSITPNFTYTLDTPPAAAITVPTNGLRVRLVANDLAPGNVALWPNQGTAGDAVQTNPAEQPVYHAPAPEFGGHASVGFNEGSDNDELLEITGVASHGSGTLIAVFRQEDATRHNYGLFAPYGSSSSRSGMVTRRSTGKKGLDYWDSTHGWVGGATVVNAGQTYVGVWRVDAGVAVDLQLDGVDITSKAIGSGFPTFNRYTIGNSNPGTNSRFDGRVAEVLFYDRALLDCERDDIVADLGAEYGVSVAVSGGGCQPPDPPAPPTGLSATATGEATMDLAWTDGSGNEDGFRIERRVGQGGAWSEIDTVGPNVESYGDGGLTGDTEYCYQVRAYNADGDSGYTNISCDTTDPPLPPDPPGPPSGLGATATGEATMDLAWTDGSGNEDGFRIERRVGQGGAWSEIDTVGPNVESYGDSGLTGDTEYCYQVRAYNADGNSSYTNISCDTTDPITGPPPPVSVPTTGLRVRLVADDLGPGEVASWPNRGSEPDAAQGTASKRPIYYAPAPEFSGHASVGFNEGSDRNDVLEITGVSSHESGTLIAVFRQEGASGHNYGLFGAWGSQSSRSGMVTWRKSGGRLEYWDTSNGWTGGTASPSGSVTYVGAWRIEGGAQAELYLDGVAAGSSSLGSGFPAFNRYTIGMTEPSTSTRFDGRVAEILFYDRAILDCELNDVTAALGTQYGVSVSVPGGGCSPPSDPAGLNATAAGIDGIDLTWTDTSPDEDGFRIERRLGQGGAWGEITETPANQTTFGDGGLDPDTEYCYRVQSFNGNGNSAFTLPACATTDAVGPLPPPVAVPATGLRLRLIANDLEAGEVATWSNRGSEADAGQSDAARRPSYDAPSGDFGGNASVAFNTGSDNDEALEVSGVSSHGAGTLIAVFRQDDASGHNYGLFGAWGSSSSRAGMVTWANSTGGAFDYWDSSNGWVNGTTTVSANQTYVGVWRVSGGGQADLQVNGSAAGSAALGFALPAFDRYTIGMTEPNTSARFDGRVAEILFYDRVLVDCERDDLVALLGARYGVSVAVTGGGCVPPADPTGLSAAAVSYKQIDLAWTDNSANEDAFRVERRLGQTGSWVQIALLAPNVQAYESRGLTQATEYCYRVQASNADGFSGYSNISCATTQTAPPGACVDSGNHDDLSQLYGIQAIGAPANETWASTQTAGCEIIPWYFGLDSGIDSDHPDLNVIEATNFVSAEVGHDGEDGHGHGTHTAGSAAAIDGNGGVVGVAPGAPIHSFRVCEDGGSCESADMIAAMDEVAARKQATPAQPMVANMSIGGPIDAALDAALRGSINEGIVYAVSAGNGALGACLFPANASGVSPARVGDDEIDAFGGSAGDDGLINGVITTTSHNSAFADVNCNFGAPVSVAAPGLNIKSTWLNAGYNTISGTSMASPHAAGAALLYLQEHPNATPAEVEAAIVSLLQPWTTNDLPNASGRLFVDGL